MSNNLGPENLGENVINEAVVEQFVETINQRIDEAEELPVPEGHETVFSLEQRQGQRRRRLEVPIESIADEDVVLDPDNKGGVLLPLKNVDFLDDLDPIKDKNRIDDAKEFIKEHKGAFVVAGSLALVLAGAIGFRKRKH